MAIRVMLVEDSPTVRRMYERAFGIAGFDIMLANDGTIVYETALINRPDIIIMDVMMPNFNGLRSLEELKADGRTEKIPIIMLSAYSEDAIIKEALELGAARYLVKSEVEPKELIQIIKDTVKKK